MDTDEDALRNAIDAAPNDRAPRLVFADWLDEHGHAELATFYRRAVPPPPPGASSKIPPPLPRHRWPAGVPRPGEEAWRYVDCTTFRAWITGRTGPTPTTASGSCPRAGWFNARRAGGPRPCPRTTCRGSCRAVGHGVAGR